MSTIAAIATPRAVGGISVIRISGEKAIEIAEKVFFPVSDKKVSEMKGYTCAFGKVKSADRELDEGILTIFRAPKSYTGEDVAEISCHGGIFVTNEVLRAVIAAGAEPAQAGEFTKRAFLNGKLSLTQAEAVADIIAAQGRQLHKCALSLHEGALFKRVKAVSDSLVHLLGELAAWVDYPEEDIPEVDASNMLITLGKAVSELKKILKTYDEGKILREGIDTAIIGKPNVGKSTLMNLLLGYERSIVTEIAGTTRDIVEESARLGDIVLRLSDTAGIRETGDVVENIGVSLSLKKLDSAQLVIAVFDNSKELSHEDFQIIEKTQEKTAVAVINKCDKENMLDKAFIYENFENVVEISAKDEKSLDVLREKIEKIFKTSEIDPSAGVIANERQKRCVQMATSSLEDAVFALESGQTLDAVTVLIDEGVSYLLELTGERVSEAVVNEVFSNFCVGK